MSSFTQHTRLLAVILFGVVAVILWIGFALFIALPQTNHWLIIGVGIAGILATSLVSAWVAPTMASEARAGTKISKSALLGAFVMFASFALAAILFSLGSMLIFFIINPNYQIKQALEETLLTAYISFGASITLLSPGFLFGAAAGALFNHLTREE